MQSITDTMKADHRRCDELFVHVEQQGASGDWAVTGNKYMEFRQAMEHHFAMEEQVLFPDFEQASGSTMGPTQVMRMEHQQMRGLFDDMAQAMTARDTDGFLGGAETLLVLMQQHNSKEQEILYPMTDQVLASQSAAVLERMAAIEGD